MTTIKDIKLNIEYLKNHPNDFSPSLYDRKMSWLLKTLEELRSQRYTTQKPTKPGWYWVRSAYIYRDDNGDAKAFVSEVYVEEGVGLILLTVCGSFSLNASWIKKYECLWSGPISEPSS